MPKDTSGLKPVAWRHYGVYLGDNSNIYESDRVNRDGNKERNIGITNSIGDITRYQGQNIKLLVSIKKTKNIEGHVYLYLSGINKRLNIFDVLAQSKTLIYPSEQWKEYEKVIKVDRDDTYIILGIGTDGPMNAWIDDIKLMVKENDTWKPVELKNGNFEEGIDGWNTDNFLYNIKLDSTQAKSGTYSLNMSSNNNAAKIGEYIKKEIGNHLVCIMPLALYGNMEHTFPVPDTQSLKQLNKNLGNITDTSLNTTHRVVKLANIVIAWNV